MRSKIFKNSRFILITGLVIFLLLVMITPVSAELRTIKQGATVFIGESNLDITNAVGSFNTIGWWESANVITTTAPTQKIILQGSYMNFQIAPADFTGYTGNWYRLAPDGKTAQGVAFIVANPTLYIQIRDFEQNSDVTGRSCPNDEHLGFLIETNMYSAVDPQYRPNVNVATDGYINIEVKGPDGTPLTSLYNSGGTTTTLTNQFVNTNTYYWGNSGSQGVSSVNNWYTGALDQNGQNRYPSGTYKVTAVSQLNGKTVSATQTVTLVSDFLMIEKNKDSTVLGRPFAVIVSGRPNSEYYLWIKGTGAMTGGYGNEAPMITLNQQGVYRDIPSNPNSIGSYQYQNGGGKTIKNDVGTDPTYNGMQYYCKIKTPPSGVRTIEFTTNTNTKPQDYTIHVEGYVGQTPGQMKSDEVMVMVEGSATTSQTTAITDRTPNTTTITTGQPTVVTTVLTSLPTSVPTPGQTTLLTTVPTTSQTTITTIITPNPTATVNYSATIAAMQSQIAEQNVKIKEQGNILDQIMTFLRNVFGWK